MSEAEAEPTSISSEDLFGLVVDQETGRLDPESTEDPEIPDAEVEPLSYEDPEIPEDVQALLDEPEEEEDEPFVFKEESEEEEFEYDEEKLALKKQLRKLEKHNQWLEGKRVTEQSVKWRSEAEQFFPFADPESIQATSRRAFMKEAKAQHSRNKEIFARTGQKAADQIVENARAEAEKIKLDAKTAAEAAWGPASPALTPKGTPNDTGETEQAAYERGGLAGVLRRQLAG